MRRLTSALILLALAAPAAAHHLEALYLDHACVAAEGRSVAADCALDEEAYLRQSTAERLPAAGGRAGIDSAGLVAPADVPGPRASKTPAWPVVTGAHAAGSSSLDPHLVAVEREEAATKVGAYDLAESTGVHFRLVCGWDLTQTRRVCAVYDPESQAETELVRDARDAAVAGGEDAVAASAAGFARDVAPAIDASVQVRRLVVDAKVEPPTTDGEDAKGREEAARPLAPAALLPDDGLVSIDLATPLSSAPSTAPPLEPPGPRPPARAATPAAADETRALGAAALPGRITDAAVVVAAGAAAGLLLIGLGVLAHRYATRANVLANAVRAAVYDAVLAKPGATITEVAQQVGIRHSTATHHLELLRDVGLVVAERVGNRKHWFGNGHVGNHDSRIDRLLPRMGRAQALVAALAQLGDARPTDLAQATGISVPGVHWHLARLEKLGVVASERTAGGRTFRVARAE